MHNKDLVTGTTLSLPVYVDGALFSAGDGHVGRGDGEEMLDFLVQEKHRDRDTAYILAGDAVDLRITQLVDGKKGVHALLPKAILLR